MSRIPMLCSSQQQVVARSIGSALKGKAGGIVKAKIVNRIGGGRLLLRDSIPVESPFAAYVEVTTACNFKCVYCAHAISPKYLEPQNMELDAFKQVIDKLGRFPQKLKTFVFVGIGEPLLHKDIARMVRYVKEAGLAERVEITTNASVLTNELSDKLIDAGLDYLRISLQGASTEQYKETSGVDIDFDRFVRRIRYFYEHKKNTQIYVKYLDMMAKSSEDSRRIHEIFGDVCDEIAVNTLIPIFKEVDFSRFDCDSKKTVHGGERMEKVEVCPKPFYMLQVKVNGEIIPCCGNEPPFDAGNAFSDDIVDMWMTKIRKFQIQMLKHKRRSNRMCAECTFPDFHTQQEDYLDDCAEELVERFGDNS